SSRWAPRKPAAASRTWAARSPTWSAICAADESRGMPGARAPAALRCAASNEGRAGAVRSRTQLSDQRHGNNRFSGHRTSRQRIRRGCRQTRRYGHRLESFARQARGSRPVRREGCGNARGGGSRRIAGASRAQGRCRGGGSDRCRAPGTFRGRGADRPHHHLAGTYRRALAAVHKLFGNAMIIGMSAVMADILTIAQASGVEAQDAIKLLGLLDLNAIVAGRGANMAKGNFTPTFELAMARKDVRLMLETAGDRPMAALPAIAARMDQLIAAGHGAEDP